MDLYDAVRVVRWMWSPTMGDILIIQGMLCFLIGFQLGYSSGRN